MKRTRTIAFVVATVAAVLVAPTAAWAKSNQLSAPAVSPASGTTSTTFAFQVSYTGFAAQSVSVAVAGMNLRMSLVSGSPTDGQFAVSSRLPAGRWPVSFSASSAKGPPASLAGPSIAVSSAAVSPPAPPAPSSSTPRPAQSAPAAPAATAPQSSLPSTTPSILDPNPVGSPAATSDSVPAAAATGARQDYRALSAAAAGSSHARCAW